MSLDGVRTYDQWVAYWRENMSLRKWNDSEGYKRGAQGIDGTKGNDYTQAHNSVKANKATFGRCWDFDGKGQVGEVSIGTGGKSGESPDYDTK